MTPYVLALFAFGLTVLATLAISWVAYAKRHALAQAWFAVPDEKFEGSGAFCKDVDRLVGARVAFACCVSLLMMCAAALTSSVFAVAALAVAFHVLVRPQALRACREADGFIERFRRETGEDPFECAGRVAATYGGKEAA